ncbi:MAG: hypothetical protein Q8Q00_04735 [Dehalococcoidia bacterium]|nr:hypothetical protein [Dehalococcoidia bacterium]
MQEQEPTSAETTDGAQAETTPAPDAADQPDPALQSILQEADRPDVSLISEMTKALKPGHHTVVDTEGTTES